MLLANRIHASTTNSFLRISMIRGALTTAGLKYLLDGDRKKPIPSPTNRFDYSERNILTVDSIDENTGAFELSFNLRVIVKYPSYRSICEFSFKFQSFSFKFRTMPLKITPSKKPLPVAKRSSLRNRSYKVEPASGRKGF